MKHQPAWHAEFAVLRYHMRIAGMGDRPPLHACPRTPPASAAPAAPGALRQPAQPACEDTQ